MIYDRNDTIIQGNLSHIAAAFLYATAMQETGRSVYQEYIRYEPNMPHRLLIQDPSERRKASIENSMGLFGLTSKRHGAGQLFYENLVYDASQGNNAAEVMLDLANNSVDSFWTCFTVLVDDAVANAKADIYRMQAMYALLGIFADFPAARVGHLRQPLLAYERYHYVNQLDAGSQTRFKQNVIAAMQVLQGGE